MGLDITGIGAIADLAKTTIKAIWPDKTEKEVAEMAATLSLIQGQLDINKVEAANPSRFTSGWRPAIGWVCAGALCSQYILRPWIQWAFIMAGHPIPELPGIDDHLWELMGGMLGLGGLRTYEKVKRAA